MMRKAHLRRSLVQFRTHPLRTSLALLGMVLGVSSVVGMMSIGEGAQREILASLEALGGDVVHVKAKEVPDSEVGKIVNDSAGLARNDLHALTRVLGELSESGYVRWMPLGVNDLPVPSYNLELAAVSSSVFSVHRLAVAAGRRLTSIDDDHARRVAVLGAEVAERAFKGNPLGKRIRIGYSYFEVVGVLERKRSGGADMPMDPERYNRSVLIPFATATEAIEPAAAYSEIDVLSMRVASLEETLRAKRSITPVLRSLHGGKDDFEVIAPEEILVQRRAAQAVLNSVLVAIAAISLLVGGIGVMNIMLANIMERVSEIGLRRAVGASREDVRDQFLIESVLVCAVGGGIGIVLGFAVSFGLGALFGLRAAFAWEAMLAAVGLSTAVGLVFGIWPAVRASRIHPVEALQHE
jgi:putative ABC transport system permease protein